MAAQAPTFPWEYPVPDNEFWNSIEYTHGRNFFQCFSAEEVEHMEFDSNISKEDKLQLLSELLNKKLALEEAKLGPKNLHDVDYPAWHRIMIALCGMQDALGNLDEEEKILRYMIDNGRDGKRDLSALNMLSHVEESRGLYAEAEDMGREVLPWLQGHEMLGVDSPQALGATRLLIKVIWKQKRYEEANDLIEETYALIDAMGGGKFVKYREEEREMLRDLVVTLAQWKDETGDGF